MLPDQRTLEQIWTETQAPLQHQMTKATYETIIRGTRLLQGDNGTSRIEAPTAMSQEWLQNRLKDIIIRTLSSVMGQQVEVEFVVADIPAIALEETAILTSALFSPETFPTETSIELELQQAPNGPASACASFAQEVDFQSLWFEKGRSSGYTQMPDYVFQFWMLYLNQIKPKTFDLPLRIISDDKRNVNDKNFTYWTPARKYSIRTLARAVGTKSVITITGGPCSCWFNEQVKKVGGTPLSKCCGRYEQAKWHQTATGTIRCQHWQTGLLEVLYQEGLIAVQIVKPPSNKPRSHEMWLQAWRNIPLLTPSQASQLNEMDQFRHTQWLERYGHLQDIDLARWEKLTDGNSLVPFLPNYDLRPETCPACQGSCIGDCACRCHKSRKFWDAYCPSQELFE